MGPLAQTQTPINACDNIYSTTLMVSTVRCRASSGALAFSAAGVQTNRKRGRAAEGTGLLNRHICKSVEGSNPSISAKIAVAAQW